MAGAREGASNLWDLTIRKPPGISFADYFGYSSQSKWPASATGTAFRAAGHLNNQQMAGCQTQAAPGEIDGGKVSAGGTAVIASRTMPIPKKMCPQACTQSKSEVGRTA
jgi:hypothetical protein